MAGVLICRTDRYMEVDVDVASSSAANTVVKLVQGATRHLVVDMAILLEVRLQLSGPPLRCLFLQLGCMPAPASKSQ